jgi:hypothetical protein
VKDGLMTKGIKNPSPFKIKMGFDEALERFIRTDPKQVEANIKRSKKRKPPGGKKKPSGGNPQSSSVVSLRSRRMRKRNG